MGCRLEIYCAQADAPSIIAVAQSFGIAAQIIGSVVPSDKKELQINIKGEEILY